jgi:RND family efflux transporter MFP subunit
MKPMHVRRWLSTALALGFAIAFPSRGQTVPAASEATGAPVRFLVAADHESPLSAVIPGRVARIAVQLGDSVRTGQLLVSLDCADVQAKRGAASAEADAAQLRYEAKAKLQGLQSAAPLEVELAAADVNRTRSQIRVLDAQLAQCRFFAPFDGRVARVHVKEGQGVAAGEPVIDLVGSGPPKTRLNAPSAWLGWLKPGALLQAKVDETGATYQLVVRRLSGRVDAVSQTIEVEADFEGDTSRVLPGMSGRAWPAPANASMSKSASAP